MTTTTTTTGATPPKRDAILLGAAQSEPVPQGSLLLAPPPAPASPSSADERTIMLANGRCLLPPYAPVGQPCRTRLEPRRSGCAGQRRDEATPQT